MCVWTAIAGVGGENNLLTTMRIPAVQCAIIHAIPLGFSAATFSLCSFFFLVFFKRARARLPGVGGPPPACSITSNHEDSLLEALLFELLNYYVREQL
jgi:hypothetical protein